MIFETHTLQKPLVEYIETIFYYKGFTPDHSIERVVPTGHVFIIFEFNDFEYHTYDKVSLTPNGTYTKVWISGMHKDYLSIQAHQDSEMLVVQFKAHGAYPFLHMPIHELTNKVLDGQALLGDEIISLRTAILETENGVDKFKLVEEWLTNRFDATKSPDLDALEILSKLMTVPSIESNALIAVYPKSQKHLINQFKTYFGLTPKVFHRIFRFNEMLKQVQNKEHLAWSQIAYEFGYADQSHFIKEFKEFSGFNPEAFIKSDFPKDEPNFFPLDREG